MMAEDMLEPFRITILQYMADLGCLKYGPPKPGWVRLFYLQRGTPEDMSVTGLDPIIVEVEPLTGRELFPDGWRPSDEEDATAEFTGAQWRFSDDGSCLTQTACKWLRDYRQRKELGAVPLEAGCN